MKNLANDLKISVVLSVCVCVGGGGGGGGLHRNMKDVVSEEEKKRGGWGFSHRGFLSSFVLLYIALKKIVL